MSGQSESDERERISSGTYLQPKPAQSAAAADTAVVRFFFFFASADATHFLGRGKLYRTTSVTLLLLFLPIHTTPAAVSLRTWRFTQKVPQRYVRHTDKHPGVMTGDRASLNYITPPVVPVLLVPATISRGSLTVNRLRSIYTGSRQILKEIVHPCSKNSS